MKKYNHPRKYGQKNAVIVLVIIMFTSQAIHANENQTRIAIDFPSQFKPGTSLPIYISIYNLMK
jgi:hypothetical protein